MDKDKPNMNILYSKIYYCCETFHYYLNKDHSIKDTATVKKRYTNYCISYNFKSHFWCSFC